MRMQHVDVVVAGLGPVGALLSARLVQQGATVLAVDRACDVFPLPRAVAADDEVQELLARTGPGLVKPMLHDVPVRFVAPARLPATARFVAPARLLGEVRLPTSASGFCGLAFFHQPALEAGLRALLTGADVRLGTTVTGLVQDAAGVRVELGCDQVRADWLVGCDGAGSVVRRLAGIPWRGRELPQRWLVCDVVGDKGQVFTYTCDPARPTVDMPLPGGHRWEWLLRGTAVPDARALVPPDVEVVRQAVYRFGARRAARWREGRVLLAGDAAHTMPPFAGQGLGAGLRDAWALAALLTNGDPAGYERLRAPHVREMTRLSLLLGSVLQAQHGAPVRDALLHRAFRAPALGPWLARGGPRRPASGVLDL